MIEKHTTRLAPYATTATPHQFHIHTLLNVLSVFTLLNVLSVFSFLFLPAFVVQKSLQHEALLFRGNVGDTLPPLGGLVVSTVRANFSGGWLSLEPAAITCLASHFTATSSFWSKLAGSPASWAPAPFPAARLLSLVPCPAVFPLAALFLWLAATSPTNGSTLFWMVLTKVMMCVWLPFNAGAQWQRMKQWHYVLAVGDLVSAAWRKQSLQTICNASQWLPYVICTWFLGCYIYSYSTVHRKHYVSKRERWTVNR